MRHPPRRIASGGIGRRRILLAAPAGLLALVEDPIGRDLIAPVADELGDLRAWAGAVGGDLQYAVTSPSRARLGRAVRHVLGGAAGAVSLSVLDRRTGARWHHQGDRPFPLASTSKVLVVAAAMIRARSLGRGLSAAQRSQARLAITVSDNAAADALYAFGGRHAGVADLAAALGMDATAAAAPVPHWGRTGSTTDDLVTMMRALARGATPLAASDNASLLALMGAVVDGQRWGVGTVRTGTVRVRVKNGWMALDPTPGHPWQVNSVGDVRGGGRDYVLAIGQRAHASQEEGFELASRIGRTIFAALDEPMR